MREVSMEQLIAQYPWLVIIAAILLGMLIMWLLEMFFLRRSIKNNLTELEGSLKQRDEELQTAHNTLMQSNAELKSKGTELQNAQTALSASDNQLADVKTQLTKSNADLDTAIKTRQQLEATLNTRTGELADLRTKFNALSGDRDQLRTTLASAQADLEDTKAHQRGAVAEVAKLTAAAAVTAATVKALESSKGELNAQVEALNGELTNTRSLLDQTNAARASVENDLADTKLRVGDLEGIRTALEGQVSELEGKNSALDADVVKLTAGALAASELIRQLEGDKASLKEQHATLQTDFESLQKTKALDDADLAEVKLQLSHVNTALGITTRDKETYQQTLAERVSELGAAQTELERAKQDNSNLLTDVAKFTARAATATALVQALESDKHNLSGQLDQVRGELETERARAATLTPAAAAEPQAVHAASEMTAPVETLAPAAVVAGDGGDDGALAYEAVCPQDLSSVRGIGAEFEQRLYNAGIGTYWEVSQCAEETLAEILKLDETQRMAINLAAIRGDALRLARETKSQKRKWKGGVPDDFDTLIGIGRVYEGRLYEAGVCTYEALAQCTVEQLAMICHAPNFNQNQYQSWIDQARVLIEARRKGL